MLIILQPILFCLITNCTKPVINVISNNFDVATETNTTMSRNTSTNINITANANTPGSPGNVTWLALGDSYTIGESVNEDERFPAQTVSLLKDDNLFIMPPQYIATTGWTTQDLLDGIATQNPQEPFDIVSLLIGVNDQYQHLDTAGYRLRFTRCLLTAIALAGNKKEHVFVLSIPDYSVTPFAQNGDTTRIKKEIDEFNSINEAITLSFNISYTNITSLTCQAKNDASLIANDGLHPSGKEYAKWAALLAPEIKKTLK